jgi:hypothetical protein
MAGEWQGKVGVKGSKIRPVQMSSARSDRKRIADMAARQARFNKTQSKDFSAAMPQ